MQVQRYVTSPACYPRVGLITESEREGGGHDKVEGKPRAVGSMDRGSVDCGEVPVSTTDVSSLHSKFNQDPNFKGINSKFVSDSLFAAGIDAVVGPIMMDSHYVRGMYNEHCLSASAKTDFTAWNDGNVITEHNPRARVWTKGSAHWHWRHTKWLTELLETEQARRTATVYWLLKFLRLYTSVLFDLASSTRV